MNKVFLGSLLVSSVLLIGCEATPSSSTEERPFGTLFDAPAEDLIETSESSAAQENVQETNFSPSGSVEERPFGTLFDAPAGDPVEISTKKNTLKELKSNNSANIDVSKDDLLYGFVNSGIIGKPVDFDTFFSDEEEQSQAKLANIFSSPVNTDPNAFNPDALSDALGGFFGSTTATPDDFDSIFLDTEQLDLGSLSSSDFDFDSDFDSDFDFDSEKQRKIRIVKNNTITTRKNNIVADKIRNEDADAQLITDLSNLEKDIPVKKKELAQMMRAKLKHKIRLLDAETALKVAEVKMKANTKSEKVVARAEDRVLNRTSVAGKDQLKRMLISEPDKYYQLKDQARRAKAKHRVIFAKVKLEYQKKIDVLESDIKSLRMANKKIIATRLTELEGQRIAEAMIVKEKIKAKNQIFVDGLYPELKPKILEYIDAVKQKISTKERQVLELLESTYTNEELARDVSRKSENRQYISHINQKIKQEQQAYEDRSRDRLFSVRNSKLDSIIKSHKRSLNRVESDGVKDLATLEAQHAREHEKQKHTLQAPYKKKEQILNQKFQQSRSKVISRFNSENYAINAKEKKESDAIKREINARVKAEIKALLDSFEAFKKEEATNAKKNSVKKPKESISFFESLF